MKIISVLIIQTRNRAYSEQSPDSPCLLSRVYNHTYTIYIVYAYTIFTVYIVHIYTYIYMYSHVYSHARKGYTCMQKHNHEDKPGTCVIFHKYSSDLSRTCLHILRHYDNFHGKKCVSSPKSC